MLNPPAVFADSNVLYATALRDILIELALERVIRLHWSPRVLDELNRAILKNRPDTSPARLAARSAAMNQALPLASVAPSPDRLLRAVLPDAGDSHVLAAALEADCSVLLTFNLKHFPADQLALEPTSITAVHPDTFLMTLLTTQAPAVLSVVNIVRQRLVAPPLSHETYLAALERSRLPATATLLRALSADL